MKHAIALALAGGTLAALSALSAAAATMPAQSLTPATPPVAHGFPIDGESADAQTGPLILLADSDDDEGGWFWSGEDDDEGDEDHDDDEGEDDDEGDDDDDGGCDPVKDPTCTAAGNAAPAGSKAPPQNGLFTNGTAPAVKSN